MSTVNIDFKADATPIVAAANKTNAALASIGASADNASKKITPAFGNMTGGAQKAAAALGPLGGVLSKISPNAGAAASSLAGAASAATGMGDAMMAAAGTATVLEAALGPVGIAVATITAAVAIGAVAYNTYRKGVEETAAAQRALAEANDLVKDSQSRVKDSVYDLKKAKGELTREDVVNRAEAEASAKLEEEAGKNAVATQKSVAAAAQDSSLQVALRATITGENVQDLADKEKKRGDDVVKTYTKIGFEIEANRQAEVKAAGELAGFEFDKQAKKEADQKADKEAGDAKDARDKAQAIADKKADDAARALKAAVDAVADAETALAKITHDSSVSNLGALGKEADAYQTKLDRIYEATDAALKNAKAAGADETKILADSLAAQEAVEKEHAENVIKIKADAAEKDAKLRKDEFDALVKAAKELEDINEAAIKKRRNDAVDFADAMAGYAVQGVEAMAEGFDKAYEASQTTANNLRDQLIAGDAVYTDAQKEELTKRIVDQQKHAKESFAIAKAAKLASAAITTAMAVVNALNDGLEAGLPGLVIGPAAAIAAGVAGGVQIAAIAAEQPSFHSGKSPDEMQATILKKEAVLNSTAAANLGRARVEQMNNGRMQGGNGGPAPIVLGHRVFEAGLKRSLDSAGVLREALHAGAVYGHRKNRRISSV